MIFMWRTLTDYTARTLKFCCLMYKYEINIYRCYEEAGALIKSSIDGVINISSKIIVLNDHNTNYDLYKSLFINNNILLVNNYGSKKCSSR